ncbi:MAG: S-methyl-5-thioribose-1-phosphate isomerase [Candidatus Omnitrophota bacterium]
MKNVFVNPIVWEEGHIRIIDQTRLPVALIYEDCVNVQQVCKAIRKLKVRGAPLIGIAAAMGFWLGLKGSKVEAWPGLLREAEKLHQYLASSRPTAVNLFWALNRMMNVVRIHEGSPKALLLELLKKEAENIRTEDIQMCYQMSRNASSLVKSGSGLMTVCNAGGLATSGYGTALGVFYRAREEGKKIKVYACETRPLLQGARLTTWELLKNGIDVTLICDNMAADLMRAGKIQGIFVGADRIASNGDFANKIGTYSLAVLARFHKIPFYCVAPVSTLDLTLKNGSQIPIEQRGREEVVSLYFKRPIAPQGVHVFNPSFDITPASLLSAIVTERGVIRTPFGANLKKIYGQLSGKH